MPVVGFYMICGNELLEKGFKKILVKSGKCKETIGKNLEVPTLKELTLLAKKIQAEKGGNYNEIYKKLLKQKTLISGVPFLFGIGIMGFFVAAVSRYFTQYRYDKEKAKKNLENQTINFYEEINTPNVFNDFA